MPDCNIERETVVVVEDEPEIAELVATTLAEDGFHVETATDGRTALDIVERYPPDAIVLDLKLPKVSGLQIVRRCQDNPATRDVPIIVMSAERDALYEGVLESFVLVEKPFDLDVLVALVEDAVLQRSSLRHVAS